MTILAIIIIALVPSMLPTWRGTFIAAGAMYLITIVAFFVLMQVDVMTTIEGPEFFAIVILCGAATAVLVLSCTSKIFIALVLSRLKPATAMRLLHIFVSAGLLLTAVLAYAAIKHYIGNGFAILLSSALVWLSLVMWQCLTMGSNRSLRSLGRAKARPLTKRYTSHGEHN